MNEYLILRLASHPDQAMPWLVWSKQESEVIASGEIASAEHLGELKEKARSRTVIALAPSVDCATCQLPLPKKNRRQALAALGYMLEDELAQDVESIHWSCYQQAAATGDVVYLSHLKIAQWLDWLREAELQVGKIVPEALALPVAEIDSLEEGKQQWHLVRLASTWLIRQSQHQTLALDDDQSLKLWLGSQSLDGVECVSYTPWPDALQEQCEVKVELAELPLAALVQGAIDSPCNLRVGEYKDRSKKPTTELGPWLKVASVAGVALLLYLVGLGIKISDLKSQEKALKAEIAATYKVAFPNVKRLPNPKAQMTQELRKIGGSGEAIENSLLDFLLELVPAYKGVKGVQIQSFRFDSKRAELRLQASAPDFQQFEQLKAAVKNGYQAELGALNQSSGAVNGTITIRRK